MNDSSGSINGKSINAKISKAGFQALDRLLKKSVKLIMGGGGAMILGHHFPLATTDIDAIPKGIPIEEFDVLVKQVAQELSLPSDWLNVYFSTFVYVLPEDYESRLKHVFKGLHLQVFALGAEDLLIMKCFAHRPKDVGHTRFLIKNGADLELVEARIEELRAKGIPEAQKAIDFFDQMKDEQEE